MTRNYTLKDAEYVVEATFFEKHCLWKENEREGHVVWEDVSSGYMHTIQELPIGDTRMPVTVQIFFAILDGKVVAFYEPTSQVVDHRLVDAWVSVESEAYRAGRKCNAMNFHQCLQEVRVVHPEPAAL